MANGDKNKTTWNVIHKVSGEIKGCPKLNLFTNGNIISSEETAHEFNLYIPIYINLVRNVQHVNVTAEKDFFELLGESKTLGTKFA